MSVYYNETDPFAVQWLRNLITAGHIAAGDVDSRSIEDVKPDDLRGYAQHHFFAGIGVWSYALRLAGVHDDDPWWTASCPCQPFSTAGKGGGFADERHLWPALLHLIRECRPGRIVGEQVASKDGLGWFDLVHADLEGEGYAVGAADLCAAGVGAPHIRQRLWWMAHAQGEQRHRDRDAGRRRRQPTDGERVGYAHGMQSEQPARLRTGPGKAQSGWPRGEPTGSSSPSFWSDAEWLPCRDGKARPVEPGTFPLAHGLAGRVGRLRAYGNAIVAPLAAEFIGTVIEAAK